MKKFVMAFSVVMMSLAVLTSGIQAGAAPSEVQIVDKKLLAVGFPTSELEGMELDQKKHLIAQGVVKFISAESHEFYYDENDNLVEKSSKPGVVAEGTISTSDLLLKITTSQLETKENKKRFTVTLNWNWTTEPGIKGDTFYNLTDKLGLSYSADFNADPHTNGGYTCSHYGEYVFSGNKYWLSDCGGRPSDLTYGGVGWNVDIRGDYRDYGWASMNVMAKIASNWDNNTNFIGKYGHDTSTNGALALTIGAAQLQFNSGSSWDEAGASAVIWY